MSHYELGKNSIPAKRDWTLAAASLGRNLMRDQGNVRYRRFRMTATGRQLPAAVDGNR